LLWISKKASGRIAVTNKISLGIFLVVLLTPSVLAQNRENRILGDNYARAALRLVIHTNHLGVTDQRILFLLDEADVEASSPAEEASFAELNRIVGNWIKTPSVDHQACYLALKASLKARNGSTPEACK
jgi:hypothetical protein